MFERMYKRMFGRTYKHMYKLETKKICRKDMIKHVAICLKFLEIEGRPALPLQFQKYYHIICIIICILLYYIQKYTSQFTRMQSILRCPLDVRTIEKNVLRQREQCILQCDERM